MQIYNTVKLESFSKKFRIIIIIMKVVSLEEDKNKICISTWHVNLTV